MKKTAPLLLGTILALLAILIVPRRLHEPEPAFEPPTFENETRESVSDGPAFVEDESEETQNAAPPSEVRFVEGYARDEDGNGVPDVKVTTGAGQVRHPGGGVLGRFHPAMQGPPTARNPARERTTETRDDGHYRLENVDREAVNIKFSHPRYLTAWLSKIPVGSADADVVMKRRGTISGVVLEKATDEPITYFTIAVGFASRFGGMAGGRFMGRARYEFKEPEGFESETGEFRLTPDRLGKMALRASAFGYADETVYLEQELTSGGEIRDVEIRLAPGARIRGTVVAAADSEPVAGAEVYWRSPNAPWQPRAVQAVTDEDGAFLIADLRAGKWHLGVIHRDFAPSSLIPLALKEGQEQEVTVRLEAGGTIAGYVTVNGKPEAGVKIRSSGPEKIIREISTDEDGYYELTGTETGEHEMSVYPGGSAYRARDSHHTSVDVEPGRITRQDFDFETGTGVIEGYVLLNGEPFREKGVHVTVRPACVGASYYAKRRSVKTDEDGYYRVDDLAADMYSVFAETGHMTRGALVEVRDRRATRLDLQFQTGTASITGTVSWPEPYEGAFVFVRDALNTEPVSEEVFLVPPRQLLAVGQCDSEGPSFEVLDLPAGSYNVTAFCYIQVPGQRIEDIIQASQIVTVEPDGVVELNLDL